MESIHASYWQYWFEPATISVGVEFAACWAAAADPGDQPMKAITVTDQNAGAAGMKLMDRPEPKAAINDVVVQVHAAGFVNTELEWPSTWRSRLPRSDAIDPWA